MRFVEKNRPKKDYSEMSDSEAMDPSSSFYREKQGSSNKNISMRIGRKSMLNDSNATHSKSFLDTFVNLKPNLASLFKDENLKKRLSNANENDIQIQNLDRSSSK